MVWADHLGERDARALGAKDTHHSLPSVGLKLHHYRLPHRGRKQRLLLLRHSAGQRTVGHVLII
jgi:hypothetical protein